MGLQLTDLHAVDVTAALSQGAVSSSGRSHRRTQAEPDRTASNDEADAVSEAAFHGRCVGPMRVFGGVALGRRSCQYSALNWRDRKARIVALDVRRIVQPGLEPTFFAPTCEHTPRQSRMLLRDLSKAAQSRDVGAYSSHCGGLWR